MRRELVVVIALVAAGCGKKDDAKKDTPEAKATDKDDKSKAKVDDKKDDKKPDEKKPDAPATCTLDGEYRLRYRSNGTDGWWLRIAIDGGKAKLKSRDVMDALRDPLTLKADGCKATITSTGDHSGDVKLELAVDPKTQLVTGTLARTKGGEKSEADSVPVTGRHDTTPNPAPACIKPGVYEIAVGTTKWKLSEGEPRAGTCDSMADIAAKARVRVELLGDQLFVDEVSSDDNEQTFGRATLGKKGDCDYDFELAIQDWSVKATLKFAADGTITGTTGDTRYQVMEDGTAGENLWACTTSGAPLAGKRVAD